MECEKPVSQPAQSDAGDQWAERLPWLGRVPFPPGEKKCKVIRSTDKVVFLQGEKVKCLVDIFVSSDLIHFGIFYVPPFQTIDPSAPHLGDECYYILQGDGVVLINDTDTYEVKKGEAFYLPAGLKHQWMNFRRHCGVPPADRGRPGCRSERRGLRSQGLAVPAASPAHSGLASDHP